MVVKGEYVFSDVDKIISQHHEQPDGTGFPGSLNARDVAPLSCMFIIAEEFVHRTFGAPLSKDMLLGIVEEFSEKYDKGNFKRPLAAFKDFADDLSFPE